MLKYNLLCLLLTWIKVVALEPDCHVLDVGPAWGQSLQKAVVQVSLGLGFVYFSDSGLDTTYEDINCCDLFYLDVTYQVPLMERDNTL